MPLDIFSEAKVEQNLMLRGVGKSYKTVIAVDHIDLNIQTGTFYAIRGRSGSGKTTLMNLLGLLDSPSKGAVFINGREVSKLTEHEKASIRLKEIGFIFQEYYLNEAFRAYENVMVPMFINPALRNTNLKDRAVRLLSDLGLEDRVHHYPRELSGGEKQRVAIARALANDPTFILADEPTGNLDHENEIIVLNILKTLAQKGKAVVVVSHNEEVSKFADDIYRMSAGVMESASYAV